MLHARQKGAVSSLALMMEEGTTGAFRPEDNVFDLPSAEALPGQEIYDMDGGADDVGRVWSADVH